MKMSTEAISKVEPIKGVANSCWIYSKKIIIIIVIMLITFNHMDIGVVLFNSLTKGTSIRRNNFCFVMNFLVQIF